MKSRVSKILLADPDLEWSKQTKKFLEKNNYIVEHVNNGKKAQYALQKAKGKNRYFAIVLNYNLQSYSCVQVLKFIKGQKLNYRIIIVLENEDPLDKGEIEEKKIIQLGISEMMIKPFELEELLENLNDFRGVDEIIRFVPKSGKISAEEKIEMLDEEVFDINIDDFFSSKTIIFDTFIRLSENSYVKILHAGDSFSKERIEFYKKKGTSKLYLYRSDRKKYIEYNNFVAKQAIDKDYLSPQKKVNLLKNISIKFIEDTYTIGLKPKIVKQGMEICESIYELIEKEERLYLVLRELNDLNPNIFTHSYLVALYSSAVVKQFEWHSKMTIETTAMAAMLHDIGKTVIPSELLFLDPKDMDKNQYRLYMKHPEEGMRLLEGLPVNKSVKEIILQHHESYDGSGFPSKIKGNKILTLANVIHLADNFVHSIQREKIKPLQNLKRILMDNDEIVRYKHTILRNFIKIFADPVRIEKAAANISKKVS
ncbi:MAG: HD domain-containing protein [Halobacteriovoraceae bacterium]|nr:HD domain-containing protein [Halobacteriovoraceae bacterium]